MPRVHFKSFAVFTLILQLVAGPAMAVTPGDASRRANARATSARDHDASNPANATQPAGLSNVNSSGVQQALGLRPFGQQERVQPVVGKQLSAPKTDPNRSLSILPALFGGGSSSAQTQPKTTQRTSQPSSTPSKGLLNDLFGSRSTAAPAAARPATSAPANVDWQGIPYHEARSKSAPKAPTPIRDPRPNETRIAVPTPPASIPQVTPALPQPPALAAAPSSRRTSAAAVTDNRVEANQPTSLSLLSSSRRSDRRDVPTLDASEIAAAQRTSTATATAKEQLVPKVVRKELTPEPARTAAVAPAAVASTGKTNKPAAATPSAEMAVNPHVATAQPQPTATNALPAADPPFDAPRIAQQPPTMPAQETAPLPIPAYEAESVAMTERDTSAGTMSMAMPNTSPAMTSPAKTGAVANTATSTMESAPSTYSDPARVPSAGGPQFVAPRLAMPATPRFEPSTTVAGHRIGPANSAFQPRSQPLSALDAASFPLGTAGAAIGSGINEVASSNPYESASTPINMLEQAVDQSAAAGDRLAQNTHSHANDPYQTGQQSAAAEIGTQQAHADQTPLSAQTPSATYQPAASAFPSNGALGAPLASTPTLPPAALDSTSQESHVAYDGNAAQPTYTAPQTTAPQPYTQPSTTTGNERRAVDTTLVTGQTTVASELPGIRVITNGPSSVIIRQTHEYEIRVENRGAIDATGVMVRAAIPTWADIKGQSVSRGDVESQVIGEADRLVWTIDSLPAGTTEKLLVRLQAMQSGTHGLDVDWTLVPQRSVTKIEVREPKLDLVIEGPESVVYGESQSYRVRVLNPGDGVAPNVVFTLSPNSPTPQTQRIGDIPSGKEAQFEVELTAQDLGDLKIHGLATGELGLKAEAIKSIQVAAAELEAVLAGPEMKYQNTDAMYHLQVINKGNATSKNIIANLALPPGIRYLGGIDQAQKRGTRLTWEIESLPPGATREYEFNCTMVSPGSQSFDFAANGSAAGTTSVALETQVESIADLVMTIQDPAAPAPVGSEVVYEILIKNRGSRQASAVSAVAQFSNGIEPLRIEGHSGQILTGQVLFDPIETIRPGQEIRIRVIAEAQNAGHHRFRTEIRSGETVLVAEEATQFLSKNSERVSRRSSNIQR